MGGGQFLDFMGGHSCYEGDIELMGVPPVPPLGKTLGGGVTQERFSNLDNSRLFKCRNCWKILVSKEEF